LTELRCLSDLGYHQKPPLLWLGRGDALACQTFLLTSR